MVEELYGGYGGGPDTVEPLLEENVVPDGVSVSSGGLVGGEVDGWLAPDGVDGVGPVTDGWVVPVVHD